MAKRTKSLSEKLGSEQPSGWRDQLGPQAEHPEPKGPAKDAPYRHKTFLITAELEARIRSLAEREHVGQNELVRYLLAWSLDQVESGAHRLPSEPVEKRTLGA